MQFLIGLLCGVAFFGALLLAYGAGQHKHTPPEVSEEEKRQAVKMQKDFQKLMEYDTTTALQRKKVT